MFVWLYLCCVVCGVWCVQGWRPSMSVEKVVLSLMAALVAGSATIAFDQIPETAYSLHRAQASYKSLVQIHQKTGWYTPPKQKG